MGVDRRAFLKGGVGAAGALALAGPFQGLVARAAGADPDLDPDLGPLLPVRDLADGVERLALPAGYVYRSFGAVGDAMTDGVSTPARQDGMAAFHAGRGRFRLVRNHEINVSGLPFGDIGKAYDGMTMGGATTLEVDRHSRELLRSWVSLNGTSFNCAGGASPWGTYLSVEETVNGPDVGPDFANQGPDYLERHGYLYEVDPNWGPGQHPKVLPVKNVGRFAHEAVAIDPRTGILYLTEDSFEFPSGIYRYRAPVNPMRARAIVDGGTLEMLRVRGSSSPVELGGVLEVGATYDVDWVTIPEPDFEGGGASNDDAIRVVSNQGFAQNAAKFARPEGVYYSKGDVFFTCTRGGSTVLEEVTNAEYGNGRGQVWCLDPRERELTLIFQSTDPSVLDLPDNMTISPRGTIVLCEDGADGNFVRLLTEDGGLVDFARNNTDRPNDEFAGATISPDGRTLFVNIQSDFGRTIAIWRENGGLRF